MMNREFGCGGLALVLYPVVLRVPLGVSENSDSDKSRDRMALLGRYARHSLRISGERSGFYPERLEKNKTGQPLPCRGIYWSVTHKPRCVAGLVSRSRAGIDIEMIKPVSNALFKRVCNPVEKELFQHNDANLIFFKCFTAKEAVLKLLGTGLKGLAGIRIAEVPDFLNIILTYQNYIYQVEHFIVDGHIASVVKGESRVIWDYVDPGER